MSSHPKYFLFLGGLFSVFSLIAILQIGWIGELLISFVPYAAIVGALIAIVGIGLWSKANLATKFLLVLVASIVVVFGVMTAEYFYTNNRISKDFNEKSSFRIGSFNKLVTNKSYENISSATSGLDVLGMVEVIPIEFEQLSEDWAYSAMTDCACDAALGSELAIFSNYPIRKFEQISFGADNGGIAIAEIEKSPGKLLSAVIVHPKAPVTFDDLVARNVQLQRITDVALDQSFPAIIMGDFNTTPWSDDFERMTRSLGEDYINIKPSGAHKTWCLGEAPIFCAPIDYMFIDSNLGVKEVNIRNIDGSDHDLIQATLSL